MTEAMPRVAFFPDSFHEVNGVAHTSRHFTAFAARHRHPFLCVRAGERKQALEQQGEQWSLELERGAFSFALEKDLRFDPAFGRHLKLITETLDSFHPDVVHITGPSELGMIGAWYARKRKLPLAASWHTNVHEYAARRAGWLRHMLPVEQAGRVAAKIESTTLEMAARFYRMAGMLYAPNPQLCALLERHTGRPCRLMPRGVDAELFAPSKRMRALDDREMVLGFVGRLSVEKNVALLGRIQQELEERGVRNFHFKIVGHGGEEGWLRSHLRRAEFTGVLRGEALAAAYAEMDLFVFPSHTDTFGNVVLEALASGVPAVVTPDGGPCSIVRHGETGVVARDEDFAAALASLMADRAGLDAMRVAARQHALRASWDAVFEGVYAGYRELLETRAERALAMAG